VKIEITRSGGMAGLTRRWSLEVSPTEVEQRWLPLAEAKAEVSDGDAPSAGAANPAGIQRDAFTYRIAIGRIEVYLAERQLEDPWRELIERALAADTSEPGKPEELL